MPQVLQSINLKLVSTESCRNIYGNDGNVDNSHICTLTQAGEGACNVIPYKFREEDASDMKNFWMIFVYFLET